jgi:hypothetical protein
VVLQADTDVSEKDAASTFMVKLCKVLNLPGYADRFQGRDDCGPREGVKDGSRILANGKARLPFLTNPFLSFADKHRVLLKMYLFITIVPIGPDRSPVLTPLLGFSCNRTI